MTAIDDDRHLRIESLDDPMREPMCRWLERHGIDPRVVPIGTTTIRDPEQRRVYFDRCIFGFDGSRLADSSSFAIVRDFVQLEAPPLPFPQQPLDAS